ncbi:hypothetical protein D3C76_1650530 [compost metagenome]
MAKLQRFPVFLLIKTPAISRPFPGNNWSLIDKTLYDLIGDMRLIKSGRVEPVAAPGPGRVERNPLLLLG